MIGKIHRLNPRKFGFINAIGSVRCYFFHANDLIDLVFDDDLLNQIVDFDTGENEKGEFAFNIRPARPPANENHSA